jgi:plasmid stability protein
MPSITLKNLSDELLDELRKAAERDRRSLTQEIIHLLETALRARPKTVEAPDAKAQVAAWRKLAGKWESDVDARAETTRITKARSPGREVDL